MPGTLVDRDDKTQANGQVPSVDSARGDPEGNQQYIEIIDKIENDIVIINEEIAELREQLNHKCNLFNQLRHAQDVLRILIGKARTITLKPESKNERKTGSKRSALREQIAVLAETMIRNSGSSVRIPEIMEEASRTGLVITGENSTTRFQTVRQTLLRRGDVFFQPTHGKWSLVVMKSASNDQ